MVKQKLKFKKVVKFNNLFDRIMWIIVLISFAIWTFYLIVLPNWFTGMWVGITIVVLIYWIFHYFENREVYYEEL